MKQLFHNLFNKDSYTIYSIFTITSGIIWVIFYLLAHISSMFSVEELGIIKVIEAVIGYYSIASLIFVLIPCMIILLSKHVLSESVALYKIEFPRLNRCSFWLLPLSLLLILISAFIEIVIECPIFSFFVESHVLVSTALFIQAVPITLACISVSITGITIIITCVVFIQKKHISLFMNE